MTYPTPLHEATLRLHLIAFAVTIHPSGCLTDIKDRLNTDSKKPSAAEHTAAEGQTPTP